jgi:FtsZ-interacting cell division protein YlmF
MDLVTLASVATQQTIKAAIPNIRRNGMPLILSIISTFLLLGITAISSDYLSRENRGFATKICLFLTGISTAVTIRLIDKGINDASLQPGTLKGESAEPRQSYQINIENYSGNLIDDSNPSSNLIDSSSELPSGRDSAPVEFSDSNLNEVIVIEPHSFEEIPQAIRSIQNGKSVVLNLTVLDPDEAQRAVDFVAGGTYGMNGHQERIGESIFLFTPQRVQASVSRFLAQKKQPLSSSDITWNANPQPKLRLLNFAQKEESEKVRGEAG